MLMQKVKEPAFWENARKDPAYAALVAFVTQEYRSLRSDTITALSYRARMRHYTDGDRYEYEAPYFRHRNWLSCAALLALLYPEEPCYLQEVQELIWAICDEYSWVLPAHCANTLEGAEETIDLFSAETAFTLAEIDYVLGDRLDAIVRARIRQRVEERILRNMEKHTYFWETVTHNWSAVCAGNVGGALLYLFPEAFEKHLPRFIGAMERLMKGFTEDGTCTEGFSYWHYGFGNYIWFADLLYQHTNGAIDLMAVPKAEKVAGYAARSVLKGGATVSFADGTMNGIVSLTMQCWLAHRFPDSVPALPAGVMKYEGVNVYWMNYLRCFCYLEYECFAGELPLRDIYLPDAGQVIFNRERYSFVIKAGHNEEHHNHNDIGSFILATEKGQVFCDLGAGRYTRQYFERPGRYEVFCTRSMGHSVPIVNGMEQLDGEQYCGSIACEGDCATIEMAGAYPEGTIASLSRRIDALKNGVRLTDSFSTFESLTERFIALSEPTVYADRIEVDGVVLRFDAACAAPTVTVEKHELHKGFFQCAFIPVYCIDFAIAPGTESVEFLFEV